MISGARDLLVLVYRLNRERVNGKENLRSKHIGSRVSDFPYMLLSTPRWPSCTETYQLCENDDINAIVDQYGQLYHDYLLHQFQLQYTVHLQS